MIIIPECLKILPYFYILLIFSNYKYDDFYLPSRYFSPFIHDFMSKNSKFSPFLRGWKYKPPGSLLENLRYVRTYVFGLVVCSHRRRHHHSSCTSQSSPFSIHRKIVNSHLPLRRQFWTTREVRQSFGNAFPVRQEALASRRRLLRYLESQRWHRWGLSFKNIP